MIIFQKILYYKISISIIKILYWHKQMHLKNIFVVDWIDDVQKAYVHTDVLSYVGEAQA